MPQTCEAIWDVLHPIVLKEPDNTDWVNIERGFYKRWDFPNAIGAIDGKHISISTFHNYKGLFSLVLLALWTTSTNSHSLMLVNMAAIQTLLSSDHHTLAPDFYREI